MAQSWTRLTKRGRKEQRDWQKSCEGGHQNGNSDDDDDDDGFGGVMILCCNFGIRATVRIFLVEM